MSATALEADKVQKFDEIVNFLSDHFFPNLKDGNLDFLSLNILRNQARREAALRKAMLENPVMNGLAGLLRSYPLCVADEADEILLVTMDGPPIVLEYQDADLVQATCGTRTVVLADTHYATIEITRDEFEQMAVTISSIIADINGGLRAKADLPPLVKPPAASRPDRFTPTDHEEIAKHTFGIANRGLANLSPLGTFAEPPEAHDNSSASPSAEAAITQPYNQGGEEDFDQVRAPSKWTRFVRSKPGSYAIATVMVGAFCFAMNGVRGHSPQIASSGSASVGQSAAPLFPPPPSSAEMPTIQSVLASGTQVVIPLPGGSKNIESKNDYGVFGMKPGPELANAPISNR